MFIAIELKKNSYEEARKEFPTLNEARAYVHERMQQNPTLSYGIFKLVSVFKVASIEIEEEEKK